MVGLRLGGTHSPDTARSSILSEGEQKVVSVAGFFAEQSAASETFPIVMDDPVTSLDHKFRELIAKRVAKESSKRQVIIFTHDISFLLLLEKHVSQLSPMPNLTPVTISKIGNIPGRVFQGVPWHASNTKQRFKYLEDRLIELTTLHSSNLEKYNHESADWYGLLRETWERVVEEVLLYGVVQRFEQEVQTRRVSGICVSDDDYKSLDLGMGEASEWMRGHDKSHHLDVARPDPAHLRESLARVRNFCKNKLKESQEVAKERNSQLKPKVATEVG